MQGSRPFANVTPVYPTLPNQLVLDGAWHDGASGLRSPLINPAIEQPFAEVAVDDLADVSSAIWSAHRAWESGWRDLAPRKRTEILFAVARAIRNHLDEIAQLETLHAGKPMLPSATFWSRFRSSAKPPLPARPKSVGGSWNSPPVI